MKPLTKEEIERRRIDACARAQVRKLEEREKLSQAAGYTDRSLPRRVHNGRRQFLWRGRWLDE